MDLQRISGLLRKLSPRQEKVIRRLFGLGCQRPHSAREVAQEFGVSAQVIAGLLGAAQRRLVVRFRRLFHFPNLKNEETMLATAATVRHAVERQHHGIQDSTIQGTAYVPATASRTAQDVVAFLCHRVASPTRC